MELIKTFLDYALHLKDHLRDLVHQYGALTNLFLFLVVFCETGLVITPFLPGDSLLFAAGALAAIGQLNVWLLAAVLAAAAILGDTVNYWVGAKVGHRAFDGSIRWLKQEHLRQTHEFYEKYGRMTIILARFVPIIRTFAPFVAGVGTMSYPVFLAYNVIGGLAWVFLGVFAGYFFGNIPVVERNFSLVIVGIVVVSTLPIAWAYLKARRRAAAVRA